jgi:hypothetical protein
MNTARYNAGGFGTQTAGLAAGGYDSTDRTNNSEEYNGTSWTEGNNLNNAGEGGASAGTQTNAAYMGRGAPPATNYFEGYNGTSWTNLTNLPTNMWYGAGAGAGYTSCLLFGGSTAPGSSNVSQCDYWNGSSWAEQPNMNTARSSLGGTGATYNAALGFGGGSSVNTESFNGSSWTEVGDMVIGSPAMGACGTQTDAVAQGTTSGATTQVWNGTNWATGPALTNPSAGGGRGGSCFSPGSGPHMFFGGYNPPGSMNNTEEFTPETTALNVKTLTQS